MPGASRSPLSILKLFFFFLLKLFSFIFFLLKFYSFFFFLLKLFHVGADEDPPVVAQYYKAGREGYDQQGASCPM